MSRNLITKQTSRAVLKIGEATDVIPESGKAVAEMKISEDKFRVMIDAIPTLAWCSLADGSVEFFNQRWHDYTGLSAQEAHRWGWKVTIHPEDLEKSMDKWRALLASGEPGELEARLRRYDGEYRWFLFRSEPLRDERGDIVRWYGTNTDIENLKRTEEKLRQDERELRRITDAIPQTIVVQDPDGIPLYANQAVLAAIPGQGLGGGRRREQGIPVPSSEAKRGTGHGKCSANSGVVSRIFPERRRGRHTFPRTFGGRGHRERRTPRNGRGPATLG